jgi:hypothetical protein
MNKLVLIFGYGPIIISAILLSFLATREVHKYFIYEYVKMECLR